MGILLIDAGGHIVGWLGGAEAIFGYREREIVGCHSSMLFVPGPGGLGVGLAIASRIAELHGGAAQARSGGTGKGSEFTLRLPRKGPPAERGAPRGSGV